MKSRTTFLDIAKVVNEIKDLINCRLANIYDLSAKSLLFKFSQTDSKEFLLIDAGTRIHKSDFLLEKSDPSFFNLKLRKYLRTKRLVDICQLGTDRIVQLSFGTLDQLHLFCEFYSQGNIILTDASFKIIALLRIVPDKHAVGLIYDPTECYTRAPMTRQRLEAMMGKEFGKVYKKRLHLDYPIILLDYLFNDKISASKDEENIMLLMKKFKLADDIILKITNESGKGYILQKTFKSQDSNEFIEYLDVQPWNFFKSNQEFVEYDTFNQALDVYFSSIEAQIMEKKARAAKNQAEKKLDAVKKSHENQIKAFDVVQETSEASAQAIELHLQEVDDLLNTLKGYLGSGMDWIVLGDMLKEQSRRGNRMAKMIVGLKLEISMVTIQLPDPFDSDNETGSLSEDVSSSEDEEPDKKTLNRQRKAPLKIDLDIYSTAYANARRYYDSRKIAVTKQEKTLAIAENMLKNTEKKIMVELKSATKSVHTGIVKMRKPFWFEKFLWFISSENYLVIGGRDANQNELLVKRYMKKEDVYVHADLHGASSVIVKNTSTDQIPPTTLFQAGFMSVVQSKAWDSKIVTSAWWVNASQVSKTAPSGEYLTQGSFMIRGKKNWLPPVNLVYGFGLFFRVEESCIGRHYYERRPWARSEESMEQTLSLQHEPKSDEYSPSLEDLNIKKTIGNSEETAESPGAIEENSMKLSIEDSPANSSESSNDEFPDTVIEVDNPDKYGLSGINESQNETIDDSAFHQLPQSNGARHLSAKQRRDLKKNGTLTESSMNSLDSSERSSIRDEPGKKALPRGKKGKMKKMKEKYAEQDEEEREMIVKFLGSAQGPQPKGKKAKAQAARKVQLEELHKEREKRRSEAENLKPSQKPSKNESLEIQQILDEENIALPDDEQTGDLTYLDSLTGQPHQDDILLFAIPVCAPWNALQKFKYKVKLTPGSLKKGKAAKSALSSFIAVASGPEGREKELELLKSIQENDLITQMLGKVKISGQTLKKGKK